MNLVSRRVFPVALPVVSLGAMTPPPTIGQMRKQLKQRLDKLRSYDIFLRDRTAYEWWKDNAPAVRWLRKPGSVALHDESHEFWSHLREGDKRQRVSAWVQLVERGLTLSGDARKGGIGLGYGPQEPTPPKRAAAIDDWLHDADSFVEAFEALRQKMRVEARVNPSTATNYLSNALKPIAWAVGLGTIGVLAIVLFTRPRLPRVL
jgi:hypothetical protein